MQKLSDNALWSLCQKYGGLARMWDRKFATLLPEVEKRKLWRKHGFYSIYEFAAKVGGIGMSTVDEVLRVYKKVENKLLLMAEIETQGYAKVRAVADLPIEEKKLVEMVRTLPKKALEMYAHDIKKEDSQIPTGWESESVNLRIDKRIEFRLKKYQQKLEKELKVPVTLKQTLEMLLDKVEEPIKEPRKPKQESTSRTPTVHVKFENNNGGKCAFPGCNKPHEVFHHPKRYAFDHSHDNIVPLCTEHHKLAHAGLIENEKSPPNEWILRDQIQLNFIDKKYQEHVARAFQT